MPRPLAVLLLLICTMFWGFAFVAQKTAMDSMGPLSFAGIRYLLAAVVTLPFALIEFRRRTAQGFRFTPRQLRLLVVLSVALCLANGLQQVGLMHTTVTNSGFLTSLYVLFTPILAFIVIRAKPHPVIYVGAPMAIIGIYYLNGGTLDRLNLGDVLMVVGALFWATQVFVLGTLARETAMPVFVSTVSFAATGILSAMAAFGVETPTFAGLTGGWIEILYAGIFSTAVAYSLQAIGQQYVPPANAAIILSAESLFAALGGALLLGERLDPTGYVGAALIFCAIVLIEALPAARQPPADLARRH